MTNESVVKMVKAGLGDAVIVSMIKSQPCKFSLSADDMIALKGAEVSDTVMAAMVKRGAMPEPAINTGNSAATLSGNVLVPEIGVYYRKDGKWLDVPPEVVNWKTGGVLKSIATVGVVKGDVNGRLNGPHSPTKLALPIKLLIYAPEGVAITEYQLIDLREKKKAREFRTVTGGVFHVSGGAQRDMMRFKADKVAVRTYTIELSDLGPGEYGFLPPGLNSSQSASAQLGKMYTFRILE